MIVLVRIMRMQERGILSGILLWLIRISLISLPQITSRWWISHICFANSVKKSNFQRSGRSTRTNYQRQSRLSQTSCTIGTDLDGAIWTLTYWAVSSQNQKVIKYTWIKTYCYECAANGPFFWKIKLDHKSSLPWLNILELHIAFGAANLLLEPRNHKKLVHPNLDDDGVGETIKLPSSLAKKSMKRKIPAQSFFSKRG